MSRLPNTHNCFACGSKNQSGLQLAMETDGKEVWAAFTPRKEHAGFFHAVHGGLITTALDEVMAWAIIATTKLPAYSAELNVRFVKPVGIGETTRVSGEITLNRRNRLFETRGEIRNQAGEICATATGKYLPLPASQLETALLDFPEEARGYFKV